jgi:hypothetical protein
LKGYKRRESANVIGIEIYKTLNSSPKHLDRNDSFGKDSYNK